MNGTLAMYRKDDQNSASAPIMDREGTQDRANAPTSMNHVGYQDSASAPAIMNHGGYQDSERTAAIMYREGRQDSASAPTPHQPNPCSYAVGMGHRIGGGSPVGVSVREG